MFILLFTIFGFSQNDTYYLKNKIERKIHPLAWESLDINETLELLYGKNRIYETSKDIQIKMATNTTEYFNTSFSPKMSIATTKKVKSIAILHKKKGERALITLFYPHHTFRKIRLPLKMLNAGISMLIKDMKIVVIVETEDNHLFMNKYNVKYEYFCMAAGDGMNCYMFELKNELNNNRLVAKYQVTDDGIGKLRFRIIHPMISYIEGEKLNSKVNFVSYITGAIKAKELFDLYTSEYIMKNPFIMIKFKDMHQDENITLFYSTIHGEVTSREVVDKSDKVEKH